MSWPAGFVVHPFRGTVWRGGMPWLWQISEAGDLGLCHDKGRFAGPLCGLGDYPTSKTSAGRSAGKCTLAYFMATREMGRPRFNIGRPVAQASSLGGPFAPLLKSSFSLNLWICFTPVKHLAEPQNCSPGGCLVVECLIGLSVSFVGTSQHHATSRFSWPNVSPMSCPSFRTPIRMPSCCT
jgi:hypothetical protein